MILHCISLVDTPLSESRFADMLEGWVDEERETHDDHDDHNLQPDSHEHDDDDEDDGGGTEDHDPDEAENDSQEVDHEKDEVRKYDVTKAIAIHF